jgi:hypothetical protein
MTELENDPILRNNFNAIRVELRRDWDKMVVIG